MFFSRAKIENNHMVKKELLHIMQNDIYATHQLLWKLFPNDADAKRDFLYRQEWEKEQIYTIGPARGVPIFYIVSQREPSPVKGLISIETKKYNPKIKSGMNLYFDVRVNPVIRIKSERNNTEKWSASRKSLNIREKAPTKLRKYCDVLMNEKRITRAEGVSNLKEINERMQNAAIKWLINKSDKSGFKIKNPELVQLSGYRQHSIRKGKNLQNISFSSIDISGSLEVTDPTLFFTTLTSGLGHSRSFGCGLLLIRRM